MKIEGFLCYVLFPQCLEPEHSMGISICCHYFWSIHLVSNSGGMISFKLYDEELTYCFSTLHLQRNCVFLVLQLEEATIPFCPSVCLGLSAHACSQASC